MRRDGSMVAPAKGWTDGPMNPPELPNLTIIEHPLVRHKVTLLRRRDTDAIAFRDIVSQLATILAYEALRDVQSEEIDVEGPLGMARGWYVPADLVTLVPILRAGLAMVPGALTMVPNAAIGHIGVRRNETTLAPEPYYSRVPTGSPETIFLLLDPMLATGGSASYAVRHLREAGARHIRLASVVTAPEGVGRMLADHPDVSILTAALDRGLTPTGFIDPGVGDAGDRINRTPRATNS